MNPVSMAGYQSSMQTPSLANFFGAANVSQNRERLGLARKQLEMEAQAQAQKLAQDKQKQQSLAAYFSGGQGQTPAQPQMMPGQTPAQMPAQDPLAGGGAPMDTAQMQAPQPQMAPQTPQQNPMARYAGLARGGYNMDEIKGFIELERTGRKDIIEQMTDRAGAMAQAAQSVEQLPEEQRAEEWLRQTNQIEQAFGVDIPDHLQQYSPDNLNAVKARAIPVLDMWKQANPGPTAAIQGYAQAKSEGFKGSFMEYLLALKEAGASNVNVGNTGELSFEEYSRRTRAKALAEAAGKSEAKRLDDYAERSDRARQQLEALETMQAILPNIKTGTLGESALEIQKAAERLGIKLDISGDTSSAELFGALSNQMTLLQREPGSGEMSNSDREFFRSAVANLSKTPEGNAMLLELAKRRARRSMELEGVYQDYIDNKQAGKDVGTWAQARSDYLDSNPLFTAEDRERARAVQNAARVPKPPPPSQFDKMPDADFQSINPADFGDDLEKLKSFNREFNRRYGNGG